MPNSSYQALENANEWSVELACRSIRTPPANCMVDNSYQENIMTPLTAQAHLPLSCRGGGGGGRGREDTLSSPSRAHTPMFGSVKDASPVATHLFII